VHGRPIVETTETLSGEDWYDEDLSGRSAEHLEYVDLDATDSTSTSGFDLTECVLRASHFNRSKHSGAAFTNCMFIECEFFGATFTDCKFIGSSFLRCSFTQLNVSGGDWSFVTLAGADLHSVTFSGVRMQEADLSGARLNGAKLRGVDLSRAVLDKADLAGADLRGSDLSALDPTSANIRRAVVDWQQAVTIATNLGLDVRGDE
jgi:uncharacterized protein YjbI with pentapeptide repeats